MREGFKCAVAKNAFLAFSMFSPIHFELDREGDHLAELVRGNCRSPASMCVRSAGSEGEIRASHLSTFRVRPCDVANSSYSPRCW